MKQIAIWVLVCLCVYGCSDKQDLSEEDTDYKIVVNENGLDKPFTEEGGTTNVCFTADGDWTAVTDQSWCSVTPASGKAGDCVVSVTTLPNETYDERNAALILRCGKTEERITLTQKQHDAMLLTSSKVELPTSGGEFSVEVKANVTFEYEIEEEARAWLQVSATSQTKALETSVLTFTAADNAGLEKRQGTILVRSSVGEETVTVYQEGATPSIVAGQEEYTVDWLEQTLDIEIKSNVSFEVEEPAVDWLKPVVTRSMSTYTLHYLVSENTTGQTREAQFVFTSPEYDSKTSVTVRQTPVNVESLERDILVKFYQDNNGEKWKHGENWCSDKPLGEWEGVLTNKDGRVIGLELDGIGTPQMREDCHSADFTKLEYLEQVSCRDCAFTVFDVTSCPSLHTLIFENCTITDKFDASVEQPWGGGVYAEGCAGLTRVVWHSQGSLNVRDCAWLPTIEVSETGGHFEVLNVSECIRLTELHVGKALVLNATNCTSLAELNVQEAGLWELYLSGCENLGVLDCSWNALEKLNLVGLGKLHTLYCDYNYLKEIDVSNCELLESLTYAPMDNVNLLTEVRVANCKALKTFRITEGSELTKLILSGLENLEELDCHKCALTELDVSGCYALKTVDCSGGHIKRLDFGDCADLQSLNCSYNQAEYLDIHNSNLFFDCSSLLDVDGNAFKQVCLKISYQGTQPQISCVGELCWGEQNDDSYPLPHHYHGYQYPEIIYE